MLTLIVAALAADPAWLDPCATALNAARAKLAAADPRFGDPPDGWPVADRPLNPPLAEVSRRARTIEGVLTRQDMVRLRFEYLDESFLWVVIATETPLPDAAWASVSPVESQTVWSRRLGARVATLSAVRAEARLRDSFLSAMKPAADLCLAAL